jgi:uncharacterized protein (DUF1810 family)
MSEIIQSVLASHFHHSDLSRRIKKTEKIIFNIQQMIPNEIFIKKINKKLCFVWTELKKMGVITNTPNACELRRMIDKRFRIIFLMVMRKKNLLLKK